MRQGKRQPTKGAFSQPATTVGNMSLIVLKLGARHWAGGWGCVKQLGLYLPSSH